MTIKILVTGATGFIGSNLLRHFKDEDVEIYRGLKELEPNSNKFDVLCDLADLSSITAI